MMCGLTCCDGGRAIGRTLKSAPASYVRILKCVPRAHASAFDGFGSTTLDKAAISILGDLHLSPEQMHLFYQARDHLRKAMTCNVTGQIIPGARVVQLGDLGHGKHGSGGSACFDYAKSFLEGLGVPTALILGNHDLEGSEFETDEENLAGWQKVFQQPHFWCKDLGSVVAIGLSTVRYRSNTNSHHEVHIDDEQVAWLERQLQSVRGRPVVIFSHAPPMGSGLKVLQNVHIKNRCAWLCHSDRPRRFIDIVKQNTNIKLWFSGHFHLSQSYVDSISVVGTTAFVETGVIGACNRDGHRHSRVLKFDSQGYHLYTCDHEDGSLRLDLQSSWSESAVPQSMVSEDQLMCEFSHKGDLSQGWSCGDLQVGIDSEFVTWFKVGSQSILALHHEMLVEYDIATSSPIGLVTKIPAGSQLSFLKNDESPASAMDGSDVTSIIVHNDDSGISECFSRNADGGFFKIYQPNKWQIMKANEATAAARLLNCSVQNCTETADASKVMSLTTLF